MYQISKAIIVVGLAAVSGYVHCKTKGRDGEGWALLAVLVLILG